MDCKTLEEVGDVHGLTDELMLDEAIMTVHKNYERLHNVVDAYTNDELTCDETINQLVACIGYIESEKPLFKNPNKETVKDDDVIDAETVEDK